MADNSLLHSDIVFKAKPDAVPYNYRISYKVSQLCLIMRICGRGDTCSLIKLHMISFALISHGNMKKLIEFVDGIGVTPIVRFDSAVNRALAFAIAYGFVVQQRTGKYKLTDSGRRLAEQIILVGDLMVTEIIDLNTLAKKLTEGKVNELVEMWRDRHAED